MIGRRQVLGTLALAGVPAAALPGAALAARSGAVPAMAPVEVLETHLANADRSLLPQPGQQLVLRRETGRAFDPSAIAVETEDGRRIGYVPPVRGGVLARLMDQGAPASAEGAPGGRLRVFLAFG